LADDPPCSHERVLAELLHPLENGVDPLLVGESDELRLLPGQEHLGESISLHYLKRVLFNFPAHLLPLDIQLEDSEVVHLDDHTVHSSPQFFEDDDHLLSFVQVQLEGINHYFLSESTADVFQDSMLQFFHLDRCLVSSSNGSESK